MPTSHDRKAFMTRLTTILPATVAALGLVLGGCSGSKAGSPPAPVPTPTPTPTPENLDRDADGIPNAQDVFPDDPARFGRSETIGLTGLGGLFSAAVGINGANVGVGLSEDGAGVIKAVKWTVSGTGASGPSQLDPLAGNEYSAAYAVGDDGLVVGESAKGSGFVAVAWPDGATTPTELELGALAAPSAAYGTADGRIVGEASSGGHTVAVLWPSASAAPLRLATLGGDTASAYAVSGAGLIVGESVDADGASRGALWKLDATGAPGAPVPLAPLAGHLATTATGIDESGTVIVGESEASTGEVHAVLWKLDAAGTPGAPTDLGAGSASAVNGVHRIAGHRDGASMWDDRNPALLESVVAGELGVSQAYGLNDSGFVVGMADHRGFVAVPR